MKKETFDFDDFLSQIQSMKKMGPLSELMKMIPGMNSKAMAGMEMDDRELIYIEAIISSMTQGERKSPKLINNSRRKRIAKGCGRTIGDVNSLIKQFTQMRKMMKMMASGGQKGMMNPQKLMGKMNKKMKSKSRRRYF